LEPPPGLGVGVDDIYHPIHKSHLRSSECYFELLFQIQSLNFEGGEIRIQMI
jgi:hypothetical protein